ncbi:MAG TPA: HDOD domain-containing protein [Terriglobia bacterium]|nr:HDOD domain-containing protein [Terriglobia bacterium]
MTPTLRELIRERVERLNSIPTVPAIIRPLLFYLERPVDQVDVQRIVDLVSCDESISAQCLRVANSAMYFRSREVKTVHGAVIVLGVREIREILLSCSLLNLLPKQSWIIDPVTFWEHSLGCGLASRFCACKVGFRDTERAYLAGLLHDLGELINLLSFQEEFRAAAQLAKSEQIPLHQAERSALGFSHCDTGKILAEQWRLPEDIAEVVEHHHDVQQAKIHPVLVALVSLADQICQAHELGYGFDESPGWKLEEDPAWVILRGEYHILAQTEPARFLLDMEQYVTEARTLVRSILRS